MPPTTSCLRHCQHILCQKHLGTFLTAMPCDMQIGCTGLHDAATMKFSVSAEESCLWSLLRNVHGTQPIHSNFYRHKLAGILLQTYTCLSGLGFVQGLSSLHTLSTLAHPRKSCRSYRSSDRTFFFQHYLFAMQGWFVKCLCREA